jgi:tryptophan 2-monooxygenase
MSGQPPISTTFADRMERSGGRPPPRQRPTIQASIEPSVSSPGNGSGQVVPRQAAIGSSPIVRRTGRLDAPHAKAKYPSHPALFDLSECFPATIAEMTENVSIHHQLGTEGRLMPALIPQTIGRYITRVLGEWGRPREELTESILGNLDRLNLTPEGDRAQLHLEITLHWHCLCEVEKRSVLESLGGKGVRLLGDMGLSPQTSAEKTPAMIWLEHTLAFTPKDEFHRLRTSFSESQSESVRHNLRSAFKAPERADAIRALSKALRMELPVDHLFDYRGFMEATGREYGKLPDELRGKLSVCVIGAGVAGIVAADGLNRSGVNTLVLEQGDAIGGRLRTITTYDKNGKKSPTPIEMGGMRFHPTQGNSYYGLVKHYRLPTIPFPNPPTVITSYIVGNEVIEVRPGGRTTDAVMRKVQSDYITAIDKAILQPIRDARDACNTAKMRELLKEAVTLFDPQSFRSGIHTQLEKHNITWGEEEWSIFGAAGIGVGGYAGYYTTGFLEQFRFLADGRLEDHECVAAGANEPLHKMLVDTQPLANGQSVEALEGRVKLGHEVTGVKRLGQKHYQVYFTNKRTGEVFTENFDEVFFAAGPREAVRLGLTTPQEGSLSLISPQLSVALERANIVPATKLAVKIPKELLDGVDLPGNIQSTKPFQQVYVLNSVEEGSSRVIFLSYQLGNNATKTAGMDPKDQFRFYLDIIRNVGMQKTDPEYTKLVRLADILESETDLQFTAWSEEKHFWGAFKMDEPGQASNTRALWNSNLRDPGDGVIFVNEENSAEGGFASGAVNSAINGVQKFIVRNGGELPPNSPFYQEALL